MSALDEIKEKYMKDKSKILTGVSMKTIAILADTTIREGEEFAAYSSAKPGEQVNISRYLFIRGKAYVGKPIAKGTVTGICVPPEGVSNETRKAFTKYRNVRVDEIGA